VLGDPEPLRVTNRSLTAPPPAPTLLPRSVCTQLAQTLGVLTLEDLQCLEMEDLADLAAVGVKAVQRRRLRRAVLFAKEVCCALC
jgi:hypothetical protein